MRPVTCNRNSRATEPKLGTKSSFSGTKSSAQQDPDSYFFASGSISIHDLRSKNFRSEVKFFSGPKKTDLLKLKSDRIFSTKKFELFFRNFRGSSEKFFIIIKLRSFHHKLCKKILRPLVEEKNLIAFSAIIFLMVNDPVFLSKKRCFINGLCGTG